MLLLSVNVGQERAISNAKSYGKTGIYKLPRSGPVEIHALGIPDDVIIDTPNHGGPDQAIYIYGAPDYAWWSQELGKDLLPGTFGENLTVSDLLSADALAGDRLQIGTVTLEVTAPSVPCVTLAARMGDPMFVKRFRSAERPGLYCRVIQTGFVEVGSKVDYLVYSGETISILEMFRNFYKPRHDLDTLRRYLAAPTPLRGRAEIEQEYQALLAKKGA